MMLVKVGGGGPAVAGAGSAHVQPESSYCTSTKVIQGFAIEYGCSVLPFTESTILMNNQSHEISSSGPNIHQFASVTFCSLPAKWIVIWSSNGAEAWVPHGDLAMVRAKDERMRFARLLPIFRQDGLWIAHFIHVEPNERKSGVIAGLAYLFGVGAILPLVWRL
ncbi:hypothetical protein DFS33DRAFT_1429859 [Desarmillaria ectypa]|nr:hypothetical protein DFS33DRAFT_1429859 [Desarmillaria ectypa]